MGSKCWPSALLLYRFLTGFCENGFAVVGGLARWVLRRGPAAPAGAGVPAAPRRLPGAARAWCGSSGHGARCGERGPPPAVPPLVRLRAEPGVAAAFRCAVRMIARRARPPAVRVPLPPERPRGAGGEGRPGRRTIAADDAPGAVPAARTRLDPPPRLVRVPLGPWEAAGGHARPRASTAFPTEPSPRPVEEPGDGGAARIDAALGLRADGWPYATSLEPPSVVEASLARPLSPRRASPHGGPIHPPPAGTRRAAWRRAIPPSARGGGCRLDDANLMGKDSQKLWTID
jgi:hypothetical protein